MVEQYAHVPAPWARRPDELYGLLGTGAYGLAETEAQHRLARFGQNVFAKKRGTPAALLLLRQLASPLIFVLLGAAALTTILREPLETAVILLAVAVNTALGFYQEYRAENTLEKLTSYIRERTRVVRDGLERETDSALVTAGDIVHLSLGARVPADARLISVNELSVDESFLTGESLPVKKDADIVSEGADVTERTCMVFAGSLVVEGSGSALIVATGGNTEIGRIAELVSGTRHTTTPLQQSLSTLAWYIFAGVAIIVAGLFVLGIYRGEPLLNMLLLSAATAVGAVPEALPIALTVILAIGVERIAAKKGIMRSLAAAETLGSTTVVLTDKTGTLTEAAMKLTGIATGKELIAGDLPPVHPAHLSEAHRAMLSDALLATEAVLENPDDPKKDWRFIGRPLEVNIAIEAALAGLDIASLTRFRRETVLPFNSTDKFSVTYDKKTDTHVALGAPDVLLRLSRLTKDDFLAMESRIHEVSAQGKRLIGVARLRRHGVAPHRIRTGDVRDLEFLGVIMLYDPIRREAADAVRRIESHGARVVMLTGDLRGTAIAIGRELGWQVDEGQAMTGEELRQLSDDELRERLAATRIFARVTPEDKLRIGRLYQSMGEIVAMTGDGVNDAPALKAADIGVALGSGSDVAKSAADLVLLNDNFETIVLAIEEGRRILSNIRKAFVYLMSNCLDEVFLIGGALILDLPLPLTAIQIIWVNFFTGSLPALSYAFEHNRDVGHARGKTIFSGEVRLLTLGIGILTSLLLFLLYWTMLLSGVELGVAQTVLFLCFAGYILGVAFSFKSLHRPLFAYRLFDNHALNISIAIAAGLIAVSMLAPFMRELLHLSPIPLMWLSLIAAWLIGNVALVEAAKWGYRRFAAR